MNENVCKCERKKHHRSLFCLIQKLGWQLIGLVAITAWTATLSGLVFGALKCIGILRVPREEEEKGNIVLNVSSCVQEFLFSWQNWSGVRLGSLMIWWFLSSGLDIPKHNEPAYPVEAYGHGHIERLLQILENNPMVVTQGRYSDIARGVGRHVVLWYGPGRGRHIYLWQSCRT